MPITRGMRPGPLRVGQDFGPRYHVIKLLGSGGMGVVYQGFDRELNEDVALKVLRAPARLAASASVAEMQRRFRAELVLARKVTHKHVIRIHDIGETDGIKFISMPLIKGRDLAAILEEGPLPAEGALRYARQIVAGLTAVHAAGVIHRDLKPSNVMIDEDDQVMLMDFGIARSNAPGTQQRTMAGAVVGTTAYMAPEQARAEAVDERTDIYGCGLILYEMLTGPRTNLTMAELMARMKAPPTAARQLNPAVPADLDAIVMKCLQPAASDRYQTSAALADALTRLNQRKKRRPAIPMTTPPWLTRAAAAAAAVAAIAALAWWLTGTQGAKAIDAGRTIAAKATAKIGALNPVTLFAREPATANDAATPAAAEPAGRADARPQQRELLRASEPALRLEPPSFERPERARSERTDVATTLEASALRLTTPERMNVPPSVAVLASPAVYRAPAGQVGIAPRFEARRTDRVTLSAARTMAMTHPLEPRRQDQEVWTMARSLAAAAPVENASGARLMAADLAIARGDYDEAAVLLVIGLERSDNWLDRVLLGTAYAKSGGFPEAFEEFQVCHLPARQDEAPSY